MENIDKKHNNTLSFDRLVEISYWLNRDENIIFPTKNLTIHYKVSIEEYNAILVKVSKAKKIEINKYEIDYDQPIIIDILNITFKIELDD